MASWSDGQTEAQVYRFNEDVMRQRDERLAAISQKEKQSKLRRRVARSAAALIASTGLVYSNGGPTQVAENIETLPAHIESLITGPHQRSENHSTLNQEKNISKQEQEVVAKYENP